MKIDDELFKKFNCKWWTAKGSYNIICHSRKKYSIAFDESALSLETTKGEAITQIK
jgi:hypothetical protein